VSPGIDNTSAFLHTKIGGDSSSNFRVRRTFFTAKFGFEIRVTFFGSYRLVKNMGVNVFVLLHQRSFLLHSGFHG
jgi:hypothetical protein